MLVKTIKYKDLNGNEISEKLYFGMSQVDLTRFIAKYADFTGIDMDSEDAARKALEQYVTKINDEKNMPKIFEFLEDFILTAYGRKSDDGKRFEKPRELRQAFEWSVAYANLFEELFSDTDKFADFMNGVIDDRGAAATQTSGVKVVQ